MAKTAILTTAPAAGTLGGVKSFPKFETVGERLTWFKKYLYDSKHFALRAMEMIYAFQTASEKVAKETAEDNGVGFTGADANFLSSLVQQATANKKKTLQKGWWLLSDKQAEKMCKTMPKYAGQLISILENDGKLAKMGAKAKAPLIETVTINKDFDGNTMEKQAVIDEMNDGEPLENDPDNHN